MRKLLMALSTAAALLMLGSAAVQASAAAQAAVHVRAAVHARAAVGAGAAGHSRNSSRPDATPACGAGCFDLSSLVYGTHLIQNAFIFGDTGIGGKVGQDLNLKTASNTHPNEDFTGANVGDLASYCGAMISSTSYVCINYPSTFPVFESNWAAFGNESGLCAGVATANVNNEAVTLQNCGTSARTLWVGDLRDATTNRGRTYTPWVSASDPNVTHPLVLTVGGPTGRPTHQLSVARLNKLTGNVVPDSQEFTFELGPTP